MLHWDSLGVTLPIMAAGWLGVFAVLGVIVGAVYLLHFLTRSK